MVLFVDDTTVLLSDSDAHKLAAIITLELDKLYKWTKCNKLKVNFDKTCFILFGPKIGTNAVKINIYFNNNLIKNVSSTKFLGIIISSNLSWADHIKFISKKISKNIGIIYKLKNNFPEYIVRQLYYSLVYPYFNYCISIWGNSPKYLLSLLKRCQNSFF